MPSSVHHAGAREPSSKMASWLWACVLLSPILTPHGLDFHSDVQTEGSDNGTARFKLHSSGQLIDVLYLDSSADFDVWLGWDGQLRVHSLTSGDGNETWWPGRLLLGGKVRQLSTNGSVTQVSLLARVKAVQQLEEGLLKIELQRERNVDLLQSGTIHMEFSPPDFPAHQGHVPSGHLPDLPLGSEVEALQISMHQDMVAMEASADKAEVELVVGPPAAALQPNDSTDLMIKLTDAHVTHKPHQSVTIKAGNGKISTQSCYTTVSTVQVTMSGTLEARARNEIGVEKRHLVSSSPSRPLHRLPLALPPSTPALLFVTSFSSATWLDVYVTTSGPFHFRGSYNASGNIITESSVCAGEPPMSTSNFTGWTADVSPWWGRSNAHFKAKVTFYHEVRYAHSLYFQGIKEPVKSLPSVALSVRPIALIKSSGLRDKTCLQADLSLQGRLEPEEKELQSDSVDDPGPKSGHAVDEVAWEGQLLHQCDASCDLNIPVPPPISMATACGQPSTRVSRGDPSFNRLEVVLADEVEFRGEEAQSAWCGAPGQPCPPCQSTSPEARPCADRVMAPDAARSLSRLAHLVQVEFPQRKVVVEEAWDEPDESHPRGRHGNQSLHYEGKALLLRLSSLSQESELRRLAQLALCAGFFYADVVSSSVAVCTAHVNSDEHTRHKRSATSSDCSEDDKEFQKKMQEIGDGTLRSTKRYISLADGETFPPKKTVAEVIGPPLKPKATEKLYLYTFSDVEFQWDPRITRQQPLMTHRMALRLRRLAALVRSKAAAVHVKYDASPLQEQNNYFSSGQALTLRLSPDWPLNMEQFTELAIEAGFDYIERTGETYIKVFVKLQECPFAKPIYFPSIALLAVPSPSPVFDVNDPRFPIKDQLSILPLLDGHDSSLPLSQHYKVGDFAHPDYRFFRLDPLLVTCLEHTANALGSAPPVERGWGYRPVPENRINLASRHLEEREAFPLGRAVYLKPPPDENLQEVLLDISSILLEICVPSLLQVNQKLGIGLHKDKLYLDLRVKASDDKDQESLVDIWNVDNTQLYDSLSATKLFMDKGCLKIDPVSETKVCSRSFPQDDLGYFTFSMSPFSAARSSSKFCQDTLQLRMTAAKTMTTSLLSVLGQHIPMSTINTVLNECLVDHCGGGVGIGDIWKEKVLGCAHLVKLFSKHASSPWGETRDRGAIVNADHPESSLHALACHNGSRCVENTQLYSLALTALHTRYRPDPSLSQEELLFSGEDNPSPLLEVIHQEMAHSLQGKAKVYIERPDDLGALKDTLQVLMIHNKAVTDVEFHYPDQALRDDVQERLRRLLDTWAANSCPKVSRQATAPYSSHVISPSRRKQSAEQSQGRNEARQALLNWEQDWLMRI